MAFVEGKGPLPQNLQCLSFWPEEEAAEERATEGMGDRARGTGRITVGRRWWEEAGLGRGSLCPVGETSGEDRWPGGRGTYM